MIRHGETSSSETATAEAQERIHRVNESKRIYCSTSVQLNEIGLFWKKMPNRTCITQEAQGLMGHRSIKDWSFFWLCTNTTASLKINLLLVYNSRIQQTECEQGQDYLTCGRPMQTWITRQFFMEWLYEVFSPTFKKCLLITRCLKDTAFWWTVPQCSLQPLWMIWVLSMIS